jgi:protein SCO1/2
MKILRQIAIRPLAALTLVVTAAACCLAALPASAQAGKTMPGAHVDPISFKGPNPADQFKDIFIEQKLNNQINLDLVFRDEAGVDRTLREYIGDKPVVLGMVYYECPNVCSVILNAMLVSFDAGALDLELGKDFVALAVSIDPGETSELAAEKKANYAERFHREGFDNGFRFLTGTEENIEPLADAVGYRYFYDKQTDQYAHASGIMVLTPDGKVSSYYLGTEYLPKKIQFALMDASDGIIGPLVDQLVLLCFQYDPTVGAYGFYIFNAVRLVGALTVGALVLFWIISWLQERKKPLPPELDVAAPAGIHPGAG